MVPTTDDMFLHPSLMQLAKRHDPMTNLKNLDNRLQLNYLRNFTVLMYEFELEEIEHVKGAQAGMNLKFQALEYIKPEIQRYDGIALEDSLWIFEDSCDALRAAMAMQKALANYNSH